MPTSQWGLKNDHDTADPLASAWVNDVADDLELTRWGWLSQAIADGADTDISGGADAAVAIKMTGALTAARNLILRTAAGARWWVVNATTGGFNVTVKTAAGTGISISPGSARLLYCDGTNILAATPGTAAEGALQYAEVSLTNAEMLALRATPKTLVAAPGAGRVLEFVSAVLLFDYVGAYTETADNLAVRYNDGSGAKVSDDIETTGFVDATADTMATARPKADAIVAKSGCENKALVLHNIGDGEFGGGNAGNAVRVKVGYKQHLSGW